MRHPPLPTLRCVCSVAPATGGVPQSQATSSRANSSLPHSKRAVELRRLPARRLRRPHSLRYPVLYLLHGNGGNLHSWMKDGRIQPTLDALIEKGEIPPAIVVMPDAGTTWFVDRKEKMETAFLSDLIPDVERAVPCDHDAQRPSDRRVFRWAPTVRCVSLLKHPEMFAAAGLLSPAIYDPVPPENSSATRVGVFGAPESSIRKSGRV